MLEDQLYPLRAIYERAPPWLKALAGRAFARLPARLRLGASYERTRALLARTERWDRAALEALQLERLRALLAHAEARVPYYREAFRRAGVRAADVRSLADLGHLPTLTKRDLQERLPDLVASDVPARRRLYVTTGGSTATPVGFYLEKGVARGRELAFMEDQWARVGHRPGELTAFLRGAVLTGGRPWELEPVKRRLLLSSYHLVEAHAPAFAEALARFRPRFLHAYPSSATLLAQILRARGLRPPPLAALLLGSENLYPDQRRFLEGFFGCRAYSWYGHAERAVLGGECERSTDYHLYPQYGIVELLGPGDRPVAEDGGAGEIVATALESRATPLIRYRTEDVGVLAAGPCACGRAYPRLARVEGRLQEFVITATGRPISMCALNMHSPVFDRVRRFQLHQAERGRVTLRLVPAPGFGAADEAGIRREVGEKLGPDVELALQRVAEIPPTPSGKRRFLVQELPGVHPFGA